MSKRILVCVPNDAAYKTPIIKALTKLGYTVRHFDFRKGTALTRVVSVINNGLKLESSSIQKSLSESIQLRLLHQVKIFKPQLVLIIKGHEILKKTITEITNQNIITVNWYPDWLVLWNWVSQNASSYSYFFSDCENLNRKLKKSHHGAFYLPFASDPDDHTNKEEKKYDVTFIGQYSKRRERFFSEIADLNFSIWGYNGWKKSKLATIAHNFVSVEKNLKIMRQSKIIVNILTGDDKFQPYAVNNRTFEVLGLGRFLLNHYHPILNKYFSINKDLVCFTTPQELRKKVIYYLDNETERERIAQHGWNTIRRKHTYTLRFQEMFKIISF